MHIEKLQEFVATVDLEAPDLQRLAWAAKLAGIHYRGGSTPGPRLGIPSNDPANVELADTFDALGSAFEALAVAVLTMDAEGEALLSHLRDDPTAAAS